MASSNFLTRWSQRCEKAAGWEKGISIASTSLWEMAMMAHCHEVRVPGLLADYLQKLETMFIVLPITAPIAARSTGFSSNFPKDPSARIMAATAIVHGLVLVRPDRDIRRSGELECLW